MRNLKSLTIVILGTLILMLIGFYNGYPLVYSDTGTYIYSGFDKFIPNERPISYGLFVWFFSFKYSLWFIILVQNFITAFVIYELLKTLNIKKERLNLLYLSSLTFLVFFTGIGWYSNQIMPDFFAPLLVLILFILLKREKLSWFILSALNLILVYSLISHFSHLMIASVLIIFVWISKYLIKIKLPDISLKKIIAVSGVVFLSWIILPTINYIVEKKFILSKASHVTFIAHLSGSGILEKFLDENCDKNEFKNCKLCHYKDSLPTDVSFFIWGSNILENTGGWINSKGEYDKIIKATLVTPKYLFLQIYKTFTYGLVQLTKNEIGQGLSAYNQGSAPYGQISWRFHDELSDYSISRQNRWNGVNLKLETLNTFHLLLLILSLFIVVYLITGSILSKIDPTSKALLFFVILAILINSFITAGLIAACERFQARVVWMLPLALIVLIAKNYEIIFRPFFKNRTE